MSETKVLSGGVPIPDTYLVTADQVTIVGSGTTQDPLRAAGGGAGGVDVEEDGAPIAGNPHSTVNFTGDGVTVSNVDGVATIDIPGGGSGGGVEIREDGSSLGEFTAINFTGAGATTTDAGGGVATVAVPGGVAVQNDGTPIAGNPHLTLDLVGGGISATDAGGGVAQISIVTTMFDTVLSPPAITFGPAYDNWNPGDLGNVTLVRCTTDNSSRTVRGLVGGVDGKVVCLLNVNPDVSKVESWAPEDPAASPENRFRTGFSSGGCFYYYDGTLQRWCLMTGTP